MSELIQKADHRAHIGNSSDIPDRNIMDITVLAFYPKGVFMTFGIHKGCKCDSIITGLSCDILNQYVITSNTQVDAVLVSPFIISAAIDDLKMNIG